MSLERVLRILESFGLTRSDAKTYIYIAKNGPRKEEDIAAAMKLSRTQITPILKSLLKRGVITTNSECSEVFSAFAFEELLDRLIAIKDEEAQATEKTRKELLARWQKITWEEKQTNT